MPEKITSIKIDPELWKRAKLLAVERGLTLRSLIEELLTSEVEGEEVVKGYFEVSQELLQVLEERRRSGHVPFILASEKSAVDLVREGRSA